MSAAEGGAAAAAPAPPHPLLTPLGDPSAAACDGDACALPA
ncbi:hypothetical protein [Leifsonia shinshuensis]|uniref:Uncharacterized protein n=1 Tax=Leifsonia shinshuensis TaxID=150026 RepID=A0A853CSW7_9MICO|nr:hypothetical protein [Leifsonia shinshuensis]NYJ24096.1 hypothetical protein [Leifsonia shinshuensis]